MPCCGFRGFSSRSRRNARSDVSRRRRLRLGRHVPSAMDLPPSGRGPRHPDASRRQRDRTGLVGGGAVLRCPLRLPERGMSSLRGPCRQRAGRRPDFLGLRDLGRRVCGRQPGIRSRRLGRAFAQDTSTFEPRAPPTHPWQDREAGVALNRTGTVAAVWRGSRIAILDGRDGRELHVDSRADRR